MSKKKEAKINQTAEKIKKLKIQGASNIAKSALYAYSLLPRKKTKEKLINARLTEPMLVNTLKYFEKYGKKKTLEHFSLAQEKINKYVFKLIKNNSKIFTHCHSTNVVKSLIYARKKGKNFQIYNTETRPLFQGRITAKELSKAGIKVTMFADAAFALILEKDNPKDKVYANSVFLGCDALLPSGIINKIGSKTIAELAFIHKIPLYIIADSWKFTKQVKIEERDFHEVWKKPGKIKIKNPAFEFIGKKYIKSIVSELGILNYEGFLRRVKYK